MKIKKILCTDDEEHLLTLYKTTLETAGYEVKTAINGIECGCQLIDYQPDLIIMDLSMPEMSGITTINNLKNGFLKNIQILVVSGFIGDKEKLLLKKYGIRWINKPVNLHQMLELIELY